MKFSIGKTGGHFLTSLHDYQLPPAKGCVSLQARMHRASGPVSQTEPQFTPVVAGLCETQEGGMDRPSAGLEVGS